jgi:hypothetical protein
MISVRSTTELSSCFPKKKNHCIWLKMQLKYGFCFSDKDLLDGKLWLAIQNNIAIYIQGELRGEWLLSSRGSGVRMRQRLVGVSSSNTHFAEESREWDLFLEQSGLMNMH